MLHFVGIKDLGSSSVKPNVVTKESFVNEWLISHLQSSQKVADSSVRSCNCEICFLVMVLSVNRKMCIEC